MEPTDYEYGERQYHAEDLAGHQWTFSQTIAEIGVAEGLGRHLGFALASAEEPREVDRPSPSVGLRDEETPFLAVPEPPHEAGFRRPAPVVGDAEKRVLLHGNRVTPGDLAIHDLDRAGERAGDTLEW